jgi:hypothetical protein
MSGPGMTTTAIETAMNASSRSSNGLSIAALRAGVLARNDIVAR